MIKISAKIYVALLSLLMLLVGSSILVSCTEEDDGGIAPADDYVDVSIKISAGDASGISVTRADDDVTGPNAVPGELMNTLCVFIVDNTGTIEAKFQPDLSDTDAATGDLKEWQSGKIRLSSGNKIVYAFANWDNAGSTEWNALIAKTVGGSITADDLAFTIDDPASKVDIATGKYIPMSGKAEINVKGISEISVGLERLVGKVTIAAQGEVGTNAADVTLGTLTFSGWADRVPLFGDDETTYEITYNKSYAATLNKEISANTTETVATFYVNETVNKTTGFDITLNTDRYGGTSYTASTVTTDIPRNYILPITLTLDQYVMSLNPHAWAAVGAWGEEEYYNVTVDGSYYTVTMMDVTSTFRFAPTMSYKEAVVSGVTWTWTYLNEDEAVITPTPDNDGTITSTDGTITVTNLTATPGYEYSFTLDAAWTADTAEHTRSYTVKVVFVDGMPDYTKPLSRIWQTQLMGNELINMTTLGN